MSPKTRGSCPQPYPKLGVYAFFFFAVGFFAVRFRFRFGSMSSSSSDEVAELRDSSSLSDSSSDRRHPRSHRRRPRSHRRRRLSRSTHSRLRNQGCCLQEVSGPGPWFLCASDGCIAGASVDDGTAASEPSTPTSAVRLSAPLRASSTCWRSGARSGLAGARPWAARMRAS